MSQSYFYWISWAEHCHVVDAYGIPVLHYQCKYRENEAKMLKHATDTLEELCHSLGMETLAKHDQPNAPGYSIHGLGTCLMGSDPKIAS